MEAVSQIGRCIFGWRLPLGLLAIVPAAMFIRPLSWKMLPLHLQVGAVALIVWGLLLRAWAAAYAGAHTRSALIEAPRLASGGPYALVRNPIYLGNFILGLGMVALLGDPWLLPLHLITLAILYAAIIPAEEEFLLRTFGTEFREYCRNVPRLWPRLMPWPGAGEGRPVWSQSLGELRLGALLVVIYTLLVWIGNQRMELS